MCHFVWRGTNEDEPLCQVVSHHYLYPGTFDRLHNKILCQHKIGNNEHGSTQSIQRAPLEQGHKEHRTYYDSKSPSGNPHHPFKHRWNHKCKSYGQYRQDTEGKYTYMGNSPTAYLSIPSLNLCKIPPHKKESCMRRTHFALIDDGPRRSGKTERQRRNPSPS